MPNCVLLLGYRYSAQPRSLNRRTLKKVYVIMKQSAELRAQGFICVFLGDRLGDTIIL